MALLQPYENSADRSLRDTHGMNSHPAPRRNPSHAVGDPFEYTVEIDFSPSVDVCNSSRATAGGCWRSTSPTAVGVRRTPCSMAAASTELLLKVETDCNIASVSQISQKIVVGLDVTSIRK